MIGIVRPQPHRLTVTGTATCSLLIVQMAFALLSSNLWMVVVAVTVSVRKCHNLTAKHVTLAVGTDASNEMIVTFASIPSSFNAPIGGVLVSTNRTILEHIEEYLYENYNTDDDSLLFFLEDSSRESPTSYHLKVKASVSNARDNFYYSNHYHHVYLTSLRPHKKYFYKLIFHAKVDSYDVFSKYLRTSNADKTQALREADAKIARSIPTLQKKSDGIDEIDEHHRNLIRWGPYDGTDHDCPDPEKIRSFRTAPAVGKVDAPISIAVVGDLGQFPHSEETAAHLQRSSSKIDTIILAGDIAYPEYDHRRWDTFMDFMDDYELAHYHGLQICPGNHDIDKIEHDDQIFLAYEHRFRMPRVNKPMILGRHSSPNGELLNMDIPPYPLLYEFGNAYYSYRYGSAYVIMMSAYSSMEPNSTQYNWILNEFRSINRSQTPWVIAVLHTPLYNTFGVHHRDLQIFAAKEHLEPLFVQFGVNVVFTGHIHAYLRTHAVSNNVLNQTGPIHITVGAGGRNCDAPFTSAEPEPWVAVRDSTMYGYGMFRIHNATHSEWEWIHTGALSDEHPHSNPIYHSNMTVPPGPETDRIIIRNPHVVT